MRVSAPMAPDQGSTAQPEGNRDEREFLLYLSQLSSMIKKFFSANFSTRYDMHHAKVSTVSKVFQQDNSPSEDGGGRYI